MTQHPSHARVLIFVFAIFVFAILGGVILQFSGNTDSSALVVGSATVNQNDNGLVVQDFSVEDTDLDGQFDVAYATLTLKSGSGALELSDMLLQFAGPEAMQKASYKGVYNCDALGATYAGVDKFNAQYVSKSGNYQPGLLQQGDALRVCFSLVKTFESGEVELLAVPGTGTVGVIGGNVDFDGSALSELRN